MMRMAQVRGWIDRFAALPREVENARKEIGAVYSEIAGVFEALKDVRTELRKKTKLPCFVTGTAYVTREGAIMTIGSPLVWLLPGERGTVEIDYYFPATDAVFRVEPPFLITDAKVGNLSFLTCGNDPHCREINLKKIEVGHRMMFYVLYPEETAP